MQKCVSARLKEIRWVRQVSVSVLCLRWWQVLCQEGPQACPLSEVCSLHASPTYGPLGSEILGCSSLFIQFNYWFGSVFCGFVYSLLNLSSSAVSCGNRFQILSVYHVRKYFLNEFPARKRDTNWNYCYRAWQIIVLYLASFSCAFNLALAHHPGICFPSWGLPNLLDPFWKTAAPSDYSL